MGLRPPESGQATQSLLPLGREFKRQFGEIQIDLGQIPTAKGREFVDALLDSEPNKLGEQFRAALHRQTHGHPLFTVELLREMQARGNLVQDEAGSWVEGPVINWQILPARVEAVIEQRVSRLDDPLRDILSVGSVEGEEFTAQVIAQVLDLDEQTLLRQLSQGLTQQHRLIREQEEMRIGQQYLWRYRFGHALFQQYLYDRLSLGERRLLHQQVARAVEALYGEQIELMAAQLAHHYVRSGDQDRAAAYSLQAGDQARQALAFEEAIRFYRLALEGWTGQNPAKQAETGRKLGECLWLKGHLDEALETTETAYRMFETVNDLEGAGAMQRLLGRIHWEHSQREQALHHYRRSLAILEQQSESTELARTISAISQMHMLASEYDQAISWGERALDMAKRLDAWDVTVHALNNLGTSYLEGRDPERGLALLQDSLDQALALNLPHDACRAYLNLGEGLMWRGHYGKAQTILEALHDYAQKIHVTLFVNIALIRLIELDWWSGHWSAALIRRQRLLASSDSLRSPRDMNRVWKSVLLGWIENDLGRFQTAYQELNGTLAAARTANELQVTIPHLGQLARAMAGLGREAETLEIIEECLKLITSVSYSHPANTMLLLFACRWSASRSPETAGSCLELLERADQQIDTLQTRAALSESRGCLALVRREDLEAVKLCREAVEGWGALGRPYDRLRTLQSLGQARLQANDRAGAENSFAEAAGIIEMLAGQLHQAEFQRSFLNSPLVQKIQKRRPRVE